MLFSGVQWSDSGIHIYIIYTCSFLFFSIIGYKTIKTYRVLRNKITTSLLLEAGFCYVILGLEGKMIW